MRMTNPIASINGDRPTHPMQDQKEGYAALILEPVNIPSAHAMRQQQFQSLPAGINDPTSYNKFSQLTLNQRADFNSISSTDSSIQSYQMSLDDIN